MRKKAISKMILVAAFLLGQNSHARNFYQLKLMTDLTYTNIDNGTVSVIKNFPLQVRFSDDDQFCRVYGIKTQLDCIIESGSTSYLKSYMSKQNWLALFGQLEAGGVLPVIYNNKLNRILNQCEKCNFRVSDYQSFSYQIDDSQPEAFHLIVHDISKPELL
jgi:hypothetical protein